MTTPAVEAAETATAALVGPAAVPKYSGCGALPRSEKFSCANFEIGNHNARGTETCFGERDTGFY